jgi:hypothetical protein
MRMQRHARYLSSQTRFIFPRYAAVATAAKLASLALLAGCAAIGPDVKVVSESPTQIEYTAWCGTQNCITKENITRMAEQHCQANGTSAKMVDWVLEEKDIGRGERFTYKFNCAR